MYGTVVGVLRGGTSGEHDISLKSGHAVVANLPRDKYTVKDIYIDKEGSWHERGKPSTPADILRSVDVVLSTLHGAYGESGELQRMLEQFSVPYVGADPLNSYFALHKVLSKEKAREVGIKTPKYMWVQMGSDVGKISYDIIRNLQQPVVLKPVTGGSSLGISMAGGYAQVHTALAKLLEESDVLVEERVWGTEATVGVVENFRDEKLYALPPIEIIPPQGDFFSYEAKYTGKSIERVPGYFSKEIQEELVHAARRMHEALGQRHYSRSDFIVTKKGIYFLELNSAVACGLTKESLFPKALASVGVQFPDFLSHIIDRAMIKSKPLFSHSEWQIA